VSITNISNKVNAPIVVVNNPIFFDFVHPAKEIIVNNEIIPNRNEVTPMILGSNKSLSTTLIGGLARIFRTNGKVMLPFFGL
jgi:hypothetical protein